MSSAEEKQLVVYEEDKGPPKRFETMEELYAYFGEENIADILQASKEEVENVLRPQLEQAMEQTKQDRREARTRIGELNLAMQQRNVERGNMFNEMEERVYALEKQIRETRREFAARLRAMELQDDSDSCGKEHYQRWMARLDVAEANHQKKTEFMDCFWVRGHLLPYAFMGFKDIRKDLKLATMDDLNDLTRLALLTNINRCVKLGFEYNEEHKANCKENGLPLKVSPRMNSGSVVSQRARLAEYLMLVPQPEEDAKKRGRMEEDNEASSVLEDQENLSSKRRKMH